MDSPILLHSGNTGVAECNDRVLNVVIYRLPGVNFREQSGNSIVKPTYKEMIQQRDRCACAKMHDSRLVVTTHSESIRTIHFLTTRRSKCLMFSVL